MNVEAASRFSLVFTLRISARANSLQDMSKAIEEAAGGFDYSTFLELKKTFKGNALHPAIKTAFYSKYALEHFLQKSTLPSGLDSIRAAFLNPVNILSLTFLHGTQIGTLIAMATGDRMLKPGGEVRKTGFCIHGEHNKGFAGVNRKRISGNLLADAGHAFCYAIHGHNDFNGKAIDATRHPERSVSILIKDIEDYFKQFTEKNKLLCFWQNYLGHDAPEHRIFNLQRCFLIVRALDKKEFDEKVLPKLRELISFLENLHYKEAKEINQKIFEPILLEKLPAYSPEEIALIKLDIPILFGCKNVTVVNFKRRHNKNLAYPIPLSHCKEYVYKGSLKLDEDIQVIFTSREHIERVKGYLSSKNIALPVLDMDASLLASNFIQYKQKKQNRQGT